MTAGLPPALAAAVAARLEGRSRRDVGERSGKISRGYRAGAVSEGVVRDGSDALAYAVSRMPATYAATREVLGRLMERVPGFAPVSALDAGCGPGTASFALADAFPAIAAITQLDRNTAFLALACELAAEAGLAGLETPRQVQADLTGIERLSDPADLVVLSYALTELADAALPRLLAALWAGCTGALVIVEPGTPEGYRRVLAARGVLLASGARIAAPCPHEAACPLVAPDWCHFAVRLPRSRDHRAAKGATLAYEDEKFAYLVAVRGVLYEPAAEARILDRPEVTKIGLAAKVCAPDGTVGLVTVGKRDKTAFAAVRHVRWGDGL